MTSLRVNAKSPDHHVEDFLALEHLGARDLELSCRTAHAQLEYAIGLVIENPRIFDGETIGKKRRLHPLERDAGFRSDRAFERAVHAEKLILYAAKPREHDHHHRSR